MTTPRHTLLFALSFLLPAVASAAATYNLIAPIGTLPSSVDLTTYLNGIFQTTIGIAGILAVLMLVICGIQLMTTGSVSGKGEAKQCIWNAIFGLLLAIGSWILLNTINPLLLRNDAAIAITSSPSAAGAGTTPTTQSDPTAPGCYFKYKELTTGNTAFSRSDTCTSCSNIRQGFQLDTVKYNILSQCYEVKAGTPPSPPPASLANGTTAVTGGSTCGGQAANLCEGKFRQCTNPNCSPALASSAANWASGVVTKELLKAIIVQESSCGINLYGDGGKSCGPTQLMVSTANTYRSACGVTTPVTCGWLADKANWDKAVCMTSKYLQAMSSTAICGPDVRDLAAGYNGGPSGACGPSTSCSGDTNCAGDTPPDRWECLYDDTAHQVCNTRFMSTRNYATQVLYCTQHPGY